jgi:hypothetical protein
MKPEVYAEIESHLMWKRILPTLKFHKYRDKAKHYPEKLKQINPNLLKKVFEYL